MSNQLPQTTNQKQSHVCAELARVLQAAEAKCNAKRSDYLSWDDYFMAVALLSAKRSKDPSTQVGAVIVNADNRIVAIGYNGFPRQCNDDEFPWSKIKDEQHTDPMNDKNLYVVHAEANAILNKNTATLKETRLYTTLFPCNECAKLILQSEISEIFYLSDKYSDKTIYRAAKRMFDAAGVKYNRFIPTTKIISIDLSELLEEELNQRMADVVLPTIDPDFPIDQRSVELEK